VFGLNTERISDEEDSGSDMSDFIASDGEEVNYVSLRSVYKVRFVYTRLKPYTLLVRERTIYWHYIGTVLALYSALYWHFIGTMLVLLAPYWHNFDTILALYWYYIGTILAPYKWHYTPHSL
jgi:hypothetical protein